MSDVFVVFDLGGTHFRRSLWSENAGITSFKKSPSVSRINLPDASAEELQDLLIAYILKEYAELERENPLLHLPVCSVSLGAALNGNSGAVFNSGPLWGPEFLGEFDLEGALRRCRPDVTWLIVNDVSAGVLYHREKGAVEEGRVAFLTVSSGVGLRVVEAESGRIPLSRDCGIQGEVGHLPISFTLGGERVFLVCECGGQEHLNAYCSGRGIADLVRLAVDKHALHWNLPDAVEPDAALRVFERFVHKVKARDEAALGLLRDVTRPIAHVCQQLFTFDADVSVLWVGGGVPERLGEDYFEAIYEHLRSNPLYIRANHCPEWYRERIRPAVSDAEACLVGAGLHAKRYESKRVLPLRGKAVRKRNRWEVRAIERVHYDVSWSPGLLAPENPTLASLGGRCEAFGHRRLLVVDENVQAYFGGAISRYFEFHGIETRTVVVACGEQAKNFASLQTILDAFVDFQVARRSEPVLAFGGGILTDLVGFAASTYRRGCPYVRIPTTLMGIVDAGIGVKTGINYRGHKNRLGSYAAPLACLLDPAFLRTLPMRHLRNGLAEILKMALVKNRALFDLMECVGPAALERAFQAGEDGGILSQAIEGMLEELAPNLRELNLERIVDFGHNLSPLIEACACETWLHGEAVALDMALFCVVSLRRGLLPPEECVRILKFMRSVGLPTYAPIVSERDLLEKTLHEAMTHRDGFQRIPLPVAIGEARFVNDLRTEELVEAAFWLEAHEHLAAKSPPLSEARVTRFPTKQNRSLPCEDLLR